MCETQQIISLGVRIAAGWKKQHD